MSLLLSPPPPPFQLASEFAKVSKKCIAALQSGVGVGWIVDAPIMERTGEAVEEFLERAEHIRNESLKMSLDMREMNEFHSLKYTMPRIVVFE